MDRKGYLEYLFVFVAVFFGINGAWLYFILKKSKTPPIKSLLGPIIVAAFGILIVVFLSIKYFCCKETEESNSSAPRQIDFERRSVLQSNPPSYLSESQLPGYSELSSH